MTLRHGGCSEMTRSIGTVDRIRWMATLVASAALALMLTAAFAPSHGQLPSLHAASGTATPAPAGSSSPLDPRIASIAAWHPNEAVQTIVQFKAGVTVDRARWDVT